MIYAVIIIIWMHFLRSRFGCRVISLTCYFLYENQEVNNFLVKNLYAKFLWENSFARKILTFGVFALGSLAQLVHFAQIDQFWAIG